MRKGSRLPAGAPRQGYRDPQAYEQRGWKGRYECFACELGMNNHVVQPRADDRFGRFYRVEPR